MKDILYQRELDWNKNVYDEDWLDDCATQHEIFSNMYGLRKILSFLNGQSDSIQSDRIRKMLLNEYTNKYKNKELKDLMAIESK